MNRRWLLLAALAILAALTACQSPVTPVDGEDGASAADKAAALAGAVLQAKATGDLSQVEAILDRDDANGELRDVLAEEGVFSPPAAKQLTTYLPLPSPTDFMYKNGDVLVCKGSSSVTANLMDLVLGAGYAHAGILNWFRLMAGEEECILSADVDYLTEGEGEALNYESYLDWAVSNDIVTLLRSKSEVADIGAAINGVAAIADTHDTIYAFLGYPGAVVGAFQPIPPLDDDYWYCSKVPWRVYSETGNDIQDTWFYTEAYPGGMRLVEVADALLFKVYVCYLKLLHPWWSLAKCRTTAAQDMYYVLVSPAGLISPDELRASPLLQRQFTVTAAGVSWGDTFDDAATLGWLIPY